MSLTIELNGSRDLRANYITWAPSPLKLSNAESTPRRVRVQSRSVPGGGQVQFRLDAGMPLVDELEFTLPANAQAVSLTVTGRHGQPSRADKDVTISVTDATTGHELGALPLMVRIRKNADTLTPSERDRFLSAMVALNLPGNDGVIPFLDLLNMHTEATDPEIHGRLGFLPWHRAYVLDLERRLQRIDPSVALPYWRFDQPALNVFTPDFMGVPQSNGLLSFSSTNPLVNWVNRIVGSGTPRIRRINGARFRNEQGQWMLAPFDPRTERAIAISNGQDDTINLGTPQDGGAPRFDLFADMEVDPHGGAHSSFVGQISNPATAPADPLFFLLHCNVDRLWARWQWLSDRWASQQVESYPLQGRGSRQGTAHENVGNFALDTLWPWDGDDQSPRPATAPGGTFPAGYGTGPSLRPTLGEMLDYQGQRSGGAGLGVSYADIPYEF